jgi:hypothetical protein
LVKKSHIGHAEGITLATMNPRETENIKRPDVRKDFWEFLISRHPTEGKHAKSTKNAYRWRRILQHRLVVVQFVSEQGVGVFIRGERGANAEAVAYRLRPYAGQLEKMLGVDPNFSREAPETAHYFFHDFEPLEASRRIKWKKMADWLHRRADAYQSALQQIL